MQLSVRAQLFLAALCLALPLSAAHAHPRLVKATPAADHRTSEAPRQLILTFNESLDLALTRVTVVRGGIPVALGALRLVPSDDKSIVATPSSVLTPGRYTVRWQVTGDDGHPVRGEFSFEVLPAGTAPSDGTVRGSTR